MSVHDQKTPGESLRPNREPARIEHQCQLLAQTLHNTMWIYMLSLLSANGISCPMSPCPHMSSPVILKSIKLNPGSFLIKHHSRILSGIHSIPPTHYKHKRLFHFVLSVYRTNFNVSLGYRLLQGRLLHQLVPVSALAAFGLSLEMIKTEMERVRM